MNNEQAIAYKNIVALLTDATDPVTGPNDPCWSHTLTQWELAGASAVMAKLIVALWREMGLDPKWCISRMASDAPEPEAS